VNAKSVAFTSEPVAATLAVVSGKDKFYIGTEKAVDTGSQKEELLKELDYLKGFLESVAKKLGNERFVRNAKPEVVAMEIKKKEDAEAKIKVIEESLSMTN
jgi:valyl-tRNA synthetase